MPRLQAKPFFLFTKTPAYTERVFLFFSGDIRRDHGRYGG